MDKESCKHKNTFLERYDYHVNIGEYSCRDCGAILMKKDGGEYKEIKDYKIGENK